MKAKRKDSEKKGCGKTIYEENGQMPFTCGKLCQSCSNQNPEKMGGKLQ